jgi:hypothetical protein
VTSSPYPTDKEICAHLYLAFTKLSARCGAAVKPVMSKTRALAAGLDSAAATTAAEEWLRVAVCLSR